MRRVAVITDAASPRYFFPAWHRYYGGLFGTDNLFVLTYGEEYGDFAAYHTGRVITIAPHFSDAVRVPVVTQVTAALLRSYEVVIRCDVDEFLAPHPLRYASLAEYVERLASPHVTAVGLNVFETAEDAPLDLTGPSLLAQRRHCAREGAYSKTAVVSQPIAWSDGFHNASVPPRFDDLYLFHMKYADIAGRKTWMERMVETCTPSEQAVQRHFLGELLTKAARFAALPIVEGWAAFDDPAFERRFLDAVEPPGQEQVCFRQGWTLEETALRIPAEFGTPF